MKFDRERHLAAAERASVNGQYAKAARIYLTLCMNAPQDIGYRLRLAELQHLADNLPDALRTYSSVATHYVDIGDIMKAVTVYKEMLRIDAGLHTVHLALARAYVDLGCISDGLSQYIQAICVFMERGLVAQRLNTVREMLKLDPNNVQCRVRLAEDFVEEGDIQSSVFELTYVAQLLRKQARIDEYVRVAERLVQHQPNNISIARRLAEIYLAQGRPEHALICLRPILADRCGDVEILEMVSKCFDQLGQSHKAVAVLKEVARVHETHGLTDELNDVMDRVLSLDPTDNEARQRLAEQSNLSDSLTEMGVGEITINSTEMRLPRRVQSQPDGEFYEVGFGTGTEVSSVETSNEPYGVIDSDGSLPESELLLEDSRVSVPNIDDEDLPFDVADSLAGVAPPKPIEMGLAEARIEVPGDTVAHDDLPFEVSAPHELPVSESEVRSEQSGSSTHENLVADQDDGATDTTLESDGPPIGPPEKETSPEPTDSEVLPEELAISSPPGWVDASLVSAVEIALDTLHAETPQTNAIDMFEEALRNTETGPPNDWIVEVIDEDDDVLVGEVLLDDDDDDVLVGEVFLDDDEDADVLVGEVLLDDDDDDVLVGEVFLDDDEDDDVLVGEVLLDDDDDDDDVLVGEVFLEDGPVLSGSDDISEDEIAEDEIAEDEIAEDDKSSAVVDLEHELSEVLGDNEDLATTALVDSESDQIPAADDVISVSPELAGELREFDFYLRNGLTDEARMVLVELSNAYIHHPEVVRRREQIAL